MIRFKNITDQDLRDAGWKQYLEGSRGMVWRHSENHPQVAATSLEARIIYWIDQQENANYVEEVNIDDNWSDDIGDHL